jgi:hypothetical protein
MVFCGILGIKKSSQLPESNQRPFAYEATALPTKLNWLVLENVPVLVVYHLWGGRFEWDFFRI